MDDQIRSDVVSRPEAVLIVAGRRPATTVLTLVIVCVMIVGGTTALVVGLTKHPAHPAGLPVVAKDASTRLASCPQSETHLGSRDPGGSALGRTAWR